MPLDFRLNQQESETELRVHFIQSITFQYLQSKCEKEERPQTGQAFHPSVRRTRTRRRRTALSQDTGRGAALDPHLRTLGSSHARGMQVLSTIFRISERSTGAHGVFQPEEYRRCGAENQNLPTNQIPSTHHLHSYQ